MKSNCKSELRQVWDVSTEKVGEAGVGRELSRRGWGAMLAVAELVNNFRWSQPFDHIESNNSGVRWLNCAYCCVCGVQIVLQTAFGRLSVFRSRHYDAKLCPSFVLLVYLRYGASLWFWVWCFRNGNRESPIFSSWIDRLCPYDTKILTSVELNNRNQKLHVRSPEHSSSF